MKPNKDFRLSKSSKRMLALMKTSTEMRNLWKKAFIDGELAEKQAKMAKFKELKGDKE